MSLLDPVLARLDVDFPAAVGQLEELLRIPSISTDPAFKAETRRAGQWVVDQLVAIGFEASLRDTPGHPMLVAHHPGPGTGAGPHLLYYGHYDVQPPDPLDLWRARPFEPQIVDGPHGKRVVARGAVDNKGQLMAIVEALRAWVAVHGTLPCQITMLIEGEEETGSPSFAGFVRANRDELLADVCIVSDTNSWTIDQPAITTMLRGIVSVEVTLHGPSHDLHSGMYGGAVLNPINALTRVLGQIHDDQGRVRFPAFYDDVREPHPDELAAWNRLGFSEQEFLAGAGLKTPTGEAGRSVLERIWSRPTCDLNGIWGGYTGAGFKTVIASHASAKFSCRLVAGQDPKKILAGIRAFFEARTPADGRWAFETSGGSPAVRVPAESAFLGAARRGLADIYGRDAVLIGCGGAVPAVGMIQQYLGMDSLLVGFGLEDDLIHSPNEKFELRCYENGMKSHAAILARIVELNTTSK